MSAILREQKRQDMISAAFPYQKHRRRVLGSEMAYVEVGVLLHERALCLPTFGWSTQESPRTRIQD